MKTYNQFLVEMNTDNDIRLIIEKLKNADLELVNRVKVLVGLPVTQPNSALSNRTQSFVGQ